jgi:hypothetical protein
MKLKLYGLETFEVQRKFPEFVLDSKEFPELELEMQAVAEADFMGDQNGTKDALETLYIKMYDTCVKGSLDGDDDAGESIMSIVGPYDHDKNMVENYSDEEVVFRLTGVDQG